MMISITLAALALATTLHTGASSAPPNAPPAAPPAVSVDTETDGGTATCVFTNPGYSGKCTQDAQIPAGWTAGRACGEILSCLNNTQCTRTYCSATTVRSGWKLESATSSKN